MAAKAIVCPHSYVYGPQDGTLRCKKMSYPNDCCAHVKFCRISGRWTNSEYWAQCPLLYTQNLKGEQKNGKQV